MQQTTNVGLNQWEKDDRIQMEDFNSDNAKIDAILEELAARVIPATLLEYTVGEATTRITLDVSTIDWSHWREVYLEALIIHDISASSNSKNHSFLFYANSTSYEIGSAHGYNPALSGSFEGLAQTILFVGKDPNRRITSMSIGSSMTTDSVYLPFQSVTKILCDANNSSTDYHIMPGSYFRISAVA